MTIFEITYISSGTFVSETTTKLIEAESLEEVLDFAKNKSSEITERYNTTPFGFTIKGVEGVYYIKGSIKTYHEIVQENFGKPDTILITNMKCNNYTHVIQGQSPYLFTIPFDPFKDKLI